MFLATYKNSSRAQRLNFLVGRKKKGMICMSSNRASVQCKISIVFSLHIYLCFNVILMCLDILINGERDAFKFNLDFWVIKYNTCYYYNIIRNPEPFKGKAYLQGQISRTYLQFCAGERLCGSLKKRYIPLDLMT